MEKIAIIGAGGFGREVLMLINQRNKVNLDYEFIGFFDDSLEKGILINGYPVLGGLLDLENYQGISVAIAIGSPTVKEKIAEKIDGFNLKYPNLIHPNVLIGENVVIGKGCIFCAGVIITENIIIEDFTILNLQCTVGHDTHIGAFSSFMPSVNISGVVNIAKGVYVGTGAKIINQLEIGSNTIVGAGAVVSKTLPANCTAVGIPAKPIKFHE
jgi:sugar O-acyltransferase (sialic acid O-acetyltransferase NeuD family)